MAHALEGLYALAWRQKKQQRALGAAGACKVLAALLRAPRVVMNIVLLQKTLQAICVLCRHGIEKDTRDEANEQALAAEGACEGTNGFNHYFYRYVGRINTCKTCKNLILLSCW